MTGGPKRGSIIHMDEQLFTPMNLTDEISTRILIVLAENPDQEFYQRQLAREAGVSIGAASQRLRKIAGSGLVTVRKSGRMFFYRYNLDNAVARQFKILLNVSRLYRMVQNLTPHARRVILFGSCAEGTDTAASDIDLLVLSDNGKGARDVIRTYSQPLGREISPIIVDANEFRLLRAKDRPLYNRVMGGIVLWEAK